MSEKARKIYGSFEECQKEAMTAKRSMGNKAPRTRRRFRDAGDEARYLYEKLLYWLYARCDRNRARQFAERLDRVLEGLPAALESAKGNECKALIAEARKDWNHAIEWRRKEIRLIEELRRLAASEKPIARKAILRDFSASELADRYDLLAIECWEAGRYEEALVALTESQAVCKAHRIPFDGSEIRAEILRELGREDP